MIIRVACLLATISIITSAGLWFFVWWDDRPLARMTEELEIKNHQNALQLANRYLAKHPNDMRAGILKARALSGLNRHQDADAMFQRVALRAKRFPDDPAALRAWSTSLLHLKRWPRAIKILEALLVNAPSDPDILYSLTAARIHIRQYDLALESAQRLAKIPALSDKANVMIGTIHHDQGNRRQALVAWERVLAGNPDAKNLQIPANEFLLMVGEELLALGLPDRAAKVLERSIAQRPSAGAYAGLGKSYAQTGQLDKATNAWKQALKLDRLQPAARGELANAALRSGNQQQAVDWLLPLTTSDRLDSSHAYILQRAYAQMKQPDAARQWQKKTQSLRETENGKSTLDELLRRSSDPFWTTLLYTYQLAMQARWEEAAVLSEELRKTRPDDALVRDLSDAVKNRGKLPNLSRLIGKQY